jgi:hypothetical protein
MFYMFYLHVVSENISKLEDIWCIFSKKFSNSFFLNISISIVIALKWNE